MIGADQPQRSLLQRLPQVILVPPFPKRRRTDVLLAAFEVGLREAIDIEGQIVGARLAEYRDLLPTGLLDRR
jgi:hypothetical protein